ncbi:MAG: DUF4830 domain-containing protein [Clostridiales bacterium]|jgi:hypothetical protein|nr:DUF4830 domain-containing protein [Clostridiales bacterium]
MFIFSVKADKRKICVALAAVLLVTTAVIVVVKLRHETPSAECAGVKYSLNAGTGEERVAFFRQFNWQVSPEPVLVQDVTIPAKFNDTYNNYNRIQKDQGLDLAPYAGKVCRQWVYEVLNYPQETEVRATILVYNDRVIGGDLSTTAVDGFMTGFQGEQPSRDTMSSASSGAPSSKSASGASALSSGEEAKPKASSAIPTNAWPTD